MAPTARNRASDKGAVMTTTIPPSLPDDLLRRPADVGSRARNCLLRSRPFASAGPDNCVCDKCKSARETKCEFH